MDKKSDYKFLIVQYTIESNMQSKIESNSQETDKKLTKLTGDLKEMITSMMDQTNN